MNLNASNSSMLTALNECGASVVESVNASLSAAVDSVLDCNITDGIVTVFYHNGSQVARTFNETLDPEPCGTGSAPAVNSTSGENCSIVTDNVALITYRLCVRSNNATCLLCMTCAVHDLCAVCLLHAMPLGTQMARPTRCSSQQTTPTLVAKMQVSPSVLPIASSTAPETVIILRLSHTVMVQSSLSPTA